MERNRVNAICCAILTTLDEATDEGECVSEGLLFSPMIGDLNAGEFGDIMRLLHSGGLIDRRPGNGVTISPAGRAMAAKIHAFETAVR